MAQVSPPTSKVRFTPSPAIQPALDVKQSDTPVALLGNDRLNPQLIPVFPRRVTDSNENCFHSETRQFDHGRQPFPHSSQLSDIA
jgi:hypothetical protein